VLTVRREANVPGIPTPQVFQTSHQEKGGDAFSFAAFALQPQGLGDAKAARDLAGISSSRIIKVTTQRALPDA